MQEQEQAVSAWDGLTDAIKSVSSSVYSSIARATKMGADFAISLANSVDPVLKSIGGTAESARNLSTIGVLLDPESRLGTHKMFEATTKATQRIGKATESVDKVRESAKRLNLSPDSIREAAEKNAAKVAAERKRRLAKEQEEARKRKAAEAKKKKKSRGQVRRRKPGQVVTARRRN
jgi:uncharacterized protein with WD repeat